MGGEKPFLFYGGSSDSGSPPRGRGKVAAGVRLAAAQGITPAWAGKSQCRSAGNPARWDHPRVGGEKGGPCFAPPPCRGSPPRGRGKVGGFLHVIPIDGITPAWAGKRSTGPPLTQTTVDHPRVGGEKSIISCVVVTPIGSPPHGRGKAGQRFQHIQSARITPAWARKSLKMCETSSAR